MKTIADVEAEAQKLVDARVDELEQLRDLRINAQQEKRAAANMEQIMQATGRTADAQRAQRAKETAEKAEGELKEQLDQLQNEPVITESEFAELCEPIADELLAMQADGVPIDEFESATVEAQSDMRRIHEYLIDSPAMIYFMKRGLKI